MNPGSEIRSEKILLHKVFEMWFRIPEYQRPYVWEDDEIHDLLDDLTYAAFNKPDNEYFLGSFVFQYKPADKTVGRTFAEYDLLDGQQRFTTLLILLAVIRDITKINDIKSTCQVLIFQKANAYMNIPERVRLQYLIRPEVQEFIEKFIEQEGGTLLEEEIAFWNQKEKDTTIKNISNAIKTIHTFFKENNEIDIGPFFKFLLNRVLFIYVSTEDLEDAFRLFTILNDRGIPLRNSDILKSINLGALTDDHEKKKYARMWEEAEGELGDEFDQFLSYIRTILVKEKARLNLLKEFEDQIYEPKEKDKKTGEIKPVLLQKGKPTFDLVRKYLDNYKQLFDGVNYDISKNFAFDNLIKIMRIGLFYSDWMPALMFYYDRFGNESILEFLHAINRKIAGDWLSQETTTYRIESINTILKNIESANSPSEILKSSIFTFDGDGFFRTIEGNVYGRRFALYLLLMLDYQYANHDQKMHFETLTVEHILPQNPSTQSQWNKDFTKEQREEWTNKVGNLVLITRRKNTSQGNLDYVHKRKKYFEKNIDSCPNSLRILREFDTWTPIQLEQNQKIVIEALKKYFHN